MGGHDLSALLAGAGGGSLLDLLPLQGGGGGGGGEGGGAEGGDGQLWRRKGPSFWTAEEKAAFMEVRVHAPPPSPPFMEVGMHAPPRLHILFCPPSLPSL